ncbi:aldehyde oxidase and xanthine dehydrogenase, a/b hammerhead [Streptomyces davaonensis JCM 4913]|uniref:Aldehyde oxidase and xanthine dehydrogenase, a/b hammerhead n=1 Tax=Streptomyces davaonensis (strain DSM 101723 / JCM 4913 / KCC S-0913 / 768) TaxID=1214101 RepID=K4QYW8_STRDJ|nr:xanthine dehydrogenase family protein molybdopterin-binding subunit [Streptomyces davaonensis]CCK26035.1 aldehyde oxidase and xanthine dehydrogenase, a/b hammerhead [Streptomyces davaonensis JCM 4913]
MSGELIGSETARIDGPAKVTGQAQYSADHTLANMAYGYVVLSTIGRGTLRELDTAAARRAPGVVAVYSPFDPLRLNPPPQGFGENFAALQDRRVRYHGQIIALVLADSFEQARDGAALVVARYDSDTPNVSLPAGMPGANPPTRQGASPARSTVLAAGVDSLKTALSASTATVEATFTQGAQHHVAMEPHATVAVWRDGRLTAYTGSQMPPVHAMSLAVQLGIEPARVRVVCPYVGGGFGSRVVSWSEAALAAAAARELDRPVKLVLTREQVFTAVGHRGAITQTVTLGASADGVLNAVSHESDAVMPAVGGWPMLPAQDVSAVLYKTPNLAVDQRLVPLDVPPTWAMRAPNEAPGAFALETAMDELAVSLDMDPLQLRLRNYATAVPGTTRPWSSKHLRECYEVGAERFGWSKRRARPRGRTEGQWLVGTGMATAIYPAGRHPAGARIRFHDDGTVTVATSTSDLGTGATTAVAMLAADALQLPMRRIKAELGDSALPNGAPAVGSAATGSLAPAIRAAAQAAIQALVNTAITHPDSPLHGRQADEVLYRNGYLRADGSDAISFSALLTLTRTSGAEAVGNAEGRTGDGEHAFHSFGAHFCEVRVNRFTGEPRVSRFTTVVDVGRVVNAKTTRSQLVGGIIFGIGHALLETNPMEASGRLAAGNLGEYLVPVNADIPDLDVHWLDHPDTVYSPFGARGVGELGTVGSAAAIGNAVYNATGIRIRDLPITLDKLLV